MNAFHGVCVNKVTVDGAIDMWGGLRSVFTADQFDLEVEDVAGTTRIVDALVEGGWGDDFVVAPPGHELTLRDFRPEFSSGGSGPK